MCSVPEHNYIRGDVEPCLYHLESHHVNLLHHVDDGRVCGPQNSLNELIAFLSLYLLLKISEPISTGMAYKYLNRVRLRIENGWVIMPNPELVERVLSMVGTGQSRPKGFVTPGVHRPTTDPLHEVPCEEVAIFRAATGSLLHFASDVELIAYGVKELARKMHLPTAASYQDLIRMCKFLSDKTHHVIEKTVTDPNAKVHEILIEGDSDCQGDEDSRSTSGAHVEVNGFVLSHYSTTQPGLPALSSGESEMRSLTRAGCEGVYVKHVLAEFGLESTIKIAGDASAALSAASKLSGGRMRHLKGCDAFIKKLVKRKVVRLEKI
jgi:hypothetical protein